MQEIGWFESAGSEGIQLEDYADITVQGQDVVEERWHPEVEGVGDRGQRWRC